jgi:uncharacterized membrane protein YgcG
VSAASGGEQRAGRRIASEAPPVGGPQNLPPQNIATAITDVSERVAVLVREEVELAKAEVSEKVSKLARGAVVAAVAGVFLVTALFFVLIGCAWLLYYYLPIGSEFTYFVGFFAMALILVVLGALAGLLAAKAVKKGAPPVPTMAIEEARLIRETMSSSSEPDGAPRGATASGASGVAGTAAGGGAAGVSAHRAAGGSGAGGAG